MQTYRNLLVLFLGWITISCSSGPKPDQNLIELYIYHTNDVHGHLLPNSEGEGGLAYLASVLKMVRKQDQDAIIVDVGDFYNKGSAPSVVSHDEVTADLLAQMPYYDVRTVGNNEIKIGIPRLLEYAKKKEPQPLISSNFVDNQGKLVFPPHVILKKKGLRVGIIGLTTPFKILEEYQPAEGSDPLAPYSVRKVKDTIGPVVKQLRPQVDILILASHHNFERNENIARQYPEIDLVLSGHSHFLSPDAKVTDGPMVVEAGSYAHHLGVVQLIYGKAEKKVLSKESTNWPIGVEYQVPDETMTKMIQEMYAKLAPEALTPFAEAQERLKMISYDQRMEGGIHNWVADVLQNKTKSDVAFINRNMLREDLYKGAVNKDSFLWTAPYEDQIAVVKLSRETFKKMFADAIKKELSRCCMPFAFSKMKVTITMERDKKTVKSVLVTTPQKPKLSIAFPKYVADNCSDFFDDKYCPLKDVTTTFDMRSTLMEAAREQKTIKVPLLNRVSVQ